VAALVTLITSAGRQQMEVEEEQEQEQEQGGTPGDSALADMSSRLAQFAGSLRSINSRHYFPQKFESCLCCAKRFTQLLLFTIIAKLLILLSCPRSPGHHALSFSRRERIRRRVELALALAPPHPASGTYTSTGTGKGARPMKTRLEVSLALQCIRNATRNIHVSRLVVYWHQQPSSVPIINYAKASKQASTVVI
jgi:hypothetical protein